MSYSANELLQPGDQRRGISVVLVALRWDGESLSESELIARTAKAIQQVDARHNKEVMDVKILLVDEGQQFLQIAVRANFSSPDEAEQISQELKREFGPQESSPAVEDVTGDEEQNDFDDGYDEQAPDALTRKWLYYGYASAVIVTGAFIALGAVVTWINPPSADVPRRAAPAESNLSPAGELLGGFFIAGMIGGFFGGISGLVTTWFRGTRKGLAPNQPIRSLANSAEGLFDILYGVVWINEDLRQEHKAIMDAFLWAWSSFYVCGFIVIWLLY